MLYEIGKVIGLCTLQTSALLLGALFGCALWRQGSAAQKHLILSIVMIACLFLPAGEVLFPKVKVPVLPAAMASHPIPALSSSPLPAVPAIAVNPTTTSSAVNPLGNLSNRQETKQRPALGKREIVAYGVLLWGAGVILFGARLAISTVRLRHLRREARTAALPDGVMEDICAVMRCRRRPEVCVHPGVRIPMVYGLVRPMILLPENYVSWSPGCLQSVLRHEIAHLVRGDLFVQKAINLNRGFHWFNPIVWLAEAQIRREREKACDDKVITSLGQPSLYAENLLEVVKSTHEKNLIPSGAIGMARSSEIASRIQAILSSVNRITPSKRMAAGMVMLGMGFVVSLGIVRVAHGEAKKEKKAPIGFETFTVAIQDESGKPIEGAEIKSVGLRTFLNPGAHYGLEVEKMKLSKTDGQGRAAISYQKFVDENVPTSIVTLQASHPEFASDDIDVEIAAPTPVILKRGIKVTLKAQHAGSKKLLHELYAIPNGWPPPVKWKATTDGITARIPETIRALRVVAFDGNETPLFSQPTLIGKESSGAKTLNLEVQQGHELKGKLSDNVPRPVLNGKVIALVSSPVPFAAGLNISWTTRTTIDQSGAFTLKDLPEGKVELIALCDGFVSKNPEEQSQSSSIRDAQIFTSPSAKTVEVAMEKSGTAKVIVISPEGEPLSDASVSFWPNQSLGDARSRLGTSYNQIDSLRAPRSKDLTEFPQSWEYQPFTAITGTNGIAVVHGIPSGPQSFAVNAKGLRMPISNDPMYVMPGRGATLQINAGETSTQTVRMENEGDSSLSRAIEKSQYPEASSEPIEAEKTGLPYRVEPGEDFVGVVVDESGKPLKDVSIDAWTVYPGNETRSDAEGRFKLSGLEPGRKIEVRFKLSGYTPVHITQQPVGTLTEPVILSTKTFFEGVVTNQAGKPVSGQLVRATTGGKRADGLFINHLRYEAMTNKQERYKIHVHPDTYEFQVRSSNGEVARIPES